MSDDATGSGLGNLGGSTSRPATGGASGRGVAGGVDASAGAARLPNGGASLLGRLYAGTLPLHPHTDDATGGVIDYLRTQWGADHLAAADPHAQYLTTAEANAAYLPIDYVPPASGISQADADLRYVNTWAAGDTMTGALTVNAYVMTPTHYVDGGAGTYRAINWTSSGQFRWGLVANTTAETGSNAGSDLQLIRYSDASANLGTALTLSRATGAATFGGDVTVTGTLTTTGANSQVSFRGRDGANGYTWLAAGGTAYLLDEQRGATALTVTASGNVDAVASLSAAGKPVAVSPTAGNALTWDATGFYAAAGGAGLATDPLAAATGDVFAASGNDAVGRLALGTNGHVLTADSAQTLGVKWAAPAAGALTLIAEQLLGGAAATLTFSSIPGTYRTLVLEYVVRSDGGGAGPTDLTVRFNGDGAANYDYHWIQGNSAAGQAGAGAAVTAAHGGYVPKAGDRAGAAGTYRLELPLYAGTAFLKSAIVTGSYKILDTTAGIAVITLASWWRSTAAVTQITLGLGAGSFAAGSYCALYGMS